MTIKCDDNKICMDNVFYHVLSRGVDRRKIFMNDKDRFRFIHDLFEFNDEEPPLNNNFRFSKNLPELSSSQDHNFRKSKSIRRRKLLVSIHVFCLMDNHYHLLLSVKSKGSISKFMKKLNMGYARYFNEKYKRTGALFEGRYKSIVVKDDTHFMYLPYYIHLNPLDFKFKEWRNQNLKNYKEALKFLNNYRWSSHLDYIGKQNFPSVTQRDFLLDFFGGSENYRESIEKWLREMDLSDIQDITLE